VERTVIDPRGADGADPWSRAAAVELFLSIAALIAVMTPYARFLAWVETRPGVVLPDPVLARLVPRDLTWVIFGLIYVALGVTVWSLRAHPRALAIGVRAYAIMVVFRALAMAVVPLDPPAGTIPLQDPLVEHLGTAGQVLTRDLFFSGHTATMSLVTLTARGRRLRWLLLACTVGVASCVVWQAVHYTVDVVVAPAFAYASYRISFLATAAVRRRVGATSAGAARAEGARRSAAEDPLRI
jgi:PAP2 superfamily protein